MMKKISILILTLIISFGTMAQTKKDGIKFYRYQKYRSAIKALEPLAGEDKIANYYLGLSYLDLEETAKAKSIFQRFPAHAPNMAGIARVLFIEKKDAEAKAMLESVIRKTSRKNKAAYLYAADAITYTNGGDLSKAVTWYDYYLEWKKSARVLIHKGDALRRMQKGGDAMDAYQAASEIGGYNSLSSYKQGNLWYASKTYDSALANYQRAADIDPENPLPYFDLSMAYYNINKYDRAKKEIEKYLKYSDNEPEDQMQYANILYLAKDYDGAINKMNELLQSGNGKSYMYRVLGYSHLEKGNVSEALKNMDLLFEKHPKDKLIARDYFTYGKILKKDSVRSGEALSFFNQGIEADTAKDKIPLYRELAENYKDDDDWAGAAQWYKKIVEAEDTPEKEILDYWWAGRSFYQVSDYGNAADMYSKMVAASPDDPIGHYWLAKVAAAQDPKYKTGSASELFKKYLPMVNDNADKAEKIAEANIYLAMVSYNKKQYAAARKYSTAALKANPGDADAKNILNALNKIK